MSKTVCLRTITQRLGVSDLTTEEVEQLCQLLPVLINVHVSPDNTVASATSSSTLNCGEDLIFTSNNDSITSVTVEGSSVVDRVINEAWLTTFVNGLLDGGASVQINTGDIPATLVDPTINTSPKRGDSVKQVYDNGCVFSFYDGAAWVNVPVSTESISPVSYTHLTLPTKRIV